MRFQELVKKNFQSHIVKTHIHGTPDLVCEILSPASMQRDLGIKAERYLKNGVKEYWVVYSKENRALVK